MGLLGNFLAKGVNMLAGSSPWGDYGGSGTEEKKELFNKLLDTWNSIFQGDDFFKNPEYSTLENGVDLPIKAQLKAVKTSSFDSGMKKILMDDLHQLERHQKQKQTATRVKTERGTIDFVHLNQIELLKFSLSPERMCSGIDVTQNSRTFFYFRCVKDGNTLEFRYEPEFFANYNSGQPSDCDKLELTFQSNGQTLSAFVYYQPEVTSEQWSSVCTPDLFFKKIGRTDVYENLQEFLEKLNAPILAEKNRQEEEQKRKEEEQNRKEEEEQAEKRMRTALSTYELDKSGWHKEAETILARESAESALDSFLSSSSSDEMNSNADKRAKFAKEYYEKGLNLFNNLSNKDELKEAAEAFGIATELGNLDAKAKLALCYICGYGTLRGPGFTLVGEAECKELGISILRETAEQGNATAQLYLGNLYFSGEDVEENYEEAFEWFKKAAEQGDADAQYSLAICYAHGLGTEGNGEKAFEWYKKAAEQGHADAQYSLADAYDWGSGTEEDKEKAFEWYKKSAEQGHASAQCHLADAYAHGWGTEEDKEKAIEWYKKSAEQGHAVAQANLAYAYQNGEGTEEDKEKAFEWYKKSAEQGHAVAQNQLGLCYYNGDGTEEDEEKAFEWIEKAAEQNLGIAQFNLAYFYENGIGTEPDESKAIEWYKKAAEWGMEDAIEWLKEHGIS